MKKLHLEGVHQWCLCFEDVFCAVMRMLMALWLVYCGLKFVPYADVNGIVACLLWTEVCSCKMSQHLLF